MKFTKQKTAGLFLLLLLLLLFSLPVSAEDITSEAEISPNNTDWFDGDYTTYSSLAQGETITVSSPEPVFGLYFRFDRIPSSSLTVTLPDGRTKEAEISFLHQYLSLTDLFGESAESFTLSFPDGKAKIADLYLLSEGELPDFVQVWKKAEGDCDLMLCSTHADDDQLFFLGVLPTYAGEKGYEVQVVYFVNHNNVHDRPHELLNGLYTVGVRRYPVIGEMQDNWDGATKTLEYGYRIFENQGFTEEDLVRFQVEMLRRFRPQVVVGHDVNGEYGHPQHQVNTDTLLKALAVSGDASYEAEGEPYTPEKVYLHLYSEHQITMNWDIPLDAFGGKTAYEVSKLGYACHKSQQWTWFTNWIKGKNTAYKAASEITKYNPNLYGLAYTQVGYDEVGGDFFEHLTVRSTALPETEPETEPVTEPATEPVTEKTETQAAPATEKPEDSKQSSGTETASAAETEGEEKKTEGNFLTGLLILLGVLVILLLGTLLFGRKNRRRRRKKRKNTRNSSFSKRK